MLTCERVTFAYPHAPPERGPVIRNLSLRLSPGKVTALLGPNGAGKSTLLRLLLGTLTPDEGSIRLAGHHLADLPVARRSRAVAYIGQHTTLAGPMTVRAVVSLGRHASGDQINRHAAIERAMRLTGVSHLADTMFARLSAGQQQRVSLSRAAAQLDESNPGPLGRTLLADEPVSAMDPRQAIDALTHLRTFADSGVAVVVVLHDLTLALRFAHHALLMDEHGHTAAFGPAQDVLTPELLSSVYGVDFEVINRRAIVAG